MWGYKWGYLLEKWGYIATCTPNEGRTGWAACLGRLPYDASRPPLPPKMAMLTYRSQAVGTRKTSGLELPVCEPPRKDPRHPPAGRNPSGGYPFFTGDTGDKLKNARKSLSALKKVVPGSTGDKRKSAGDTGDK